jgi:hypothetical protein
VTAFVSVWHERPELASIAALRPGESKGLGLFVATLLWGEFLDYFLVKKCSSPRSRLDSD